MSTYLYLWTVGCLAGFVAGALVLRRRHVCNARTLGALGVAWGGLILGAKWHYRLEHYPSLEAFAVSPVELLSPGDHLPLGLVTGALLAGLWCLAFRAPWRETGDALAVAASLTIPIGRVGCLLKGCCMGVACGPFAQTLHVCMRFPPGSEPYNHQIRAELIGFAATASLPVHPLPLYFGAASLATLAVLLWMLRRDAPAGALLATFCILRPVAKLSLEVMRAGAPPNVPSRLMLAVPLTVLVVTLVVLGARLLARSRNVVGARPVVPGTLVAGGRSDARTRSSWEVP
jgi:phosphatidylglycerol---prolipoprotein diacylglyceryl transferase